MPTARGDRRERGARARAPSGARPGRRSGRGRAADRRGRSPTTSTAPPPRSCRRWAIAPASRAPSTTRSPGSARCSRCSTTPTIEEIWINEPGRVFVARRGTSELTTLILTGDEVAELVERMLRTSGRRIDLSTPFVDATLPDGSRLHVVIPSITRRHMAVNIRKFVLGFNSLDELVGVGALTDQAARFLEASVVAGLNILVAGGTQSGKTTMLNALCGVIPGRERIVTVEEVFELQIARAGRRRHADAPAESRGHRRDPAAAAGERGAAHAPVAADRRRGAAGGMPRPARRAQQRAAGHVHAARELRARGAGQDVHPAAARRRERVGGVRRADRRHVGRSRRAPGHGRVAGSGGCARSSASPAASRPTPSRRPICSPSKRGRLERGDGYPPRPERYEAAGIDLLATLGPPVA